MSDASKAEHWVERIARRLNVPAEFLRQLHMERDDWVLVIKYHALVETAVTDIVVRHIGRPELTKDISSLPLNRKLKWARQMQLLPIERLEFVEGLSVLRNHVAHNISAIPKFELSSAVATMEAAVRRKLLHAWDRPPNSQEPDALRFALWMFSMLVIFECERADQSRDEELCAEEERRFAERLALQQRYEREAIVELLDSDSPSNTPREFDAKTSES